VPIHYNNLCSQSIHSDLLQFVQALLRITPNIFREGFGPDAVTAAVTRLMENMGIDPEGETPGALLRLRSH
jgi:hypothetical protein